MEDMVSEAFSQQFCTIVPVSERGLVAGSRVTPCLVKVDDGELTITAAPATLIARVPVSGLEICTPALMRKIGTGTAVRIEGAMVGVTFDMVHARQKARAARPEGGPAFAARLARRVVAIATFADGRHGFRHGRQLAREFKAALLAAGALDKAD
jgi:hypothetical protein